MGRSEGENLRVRTLDQLFRILQKHFPHDFGGADGGLLFLNSPSLSMNSM